MSKELPHISAEIKDKFKKEMDISLKFKRYESAEKMAKTYIVRYGHSALFYNYLGLCYQMQAISHDAILAFKNAIRINKDYIEARINLASCQCDLGEYENAEKTLDYITENNINEFKNGRVSSQRSRLAQKLLSTGDKEEAIKELEAAVEKRSDLYAEMFILSELYISNESFESAKIYLEQLIEKGFQKKECKQLLGICYFRLNLTDKAKELWANMGPYYEKLSQEV